MKNFIWCLCITLFLSVVGATLFLSKNSVEAAPSSRAIKAALGHRMKTYVAKDKSYSFLRPRGWSVTQNENGATIIEKANDPNGARVDLLVFSTGGKLKSSQIIDLLAKGMKQQYPSFSEGGRRVLSKKHDVTAVVFTFEENNVIKSGMGIAAAVGNAVMWGNIYGPDKLFKKYNPGALLVYMMRSLTQGKKPKRPALPKVAKKTKTSRTRKGKSTSSGSRRSRMKRAAVMSHAWNNLPHIMPKGVSSAYWGW